MSHLAGEHRQSYPKVLPGMDGHLLICVRRNGSVPAKGGKHDKVVILVTCQFVINVWWRSPKRVKGLLEQRIAHETNCQVASNYPTIISEELARDSPSFGRVLRRLLRSTMWRT